MEVFLLLPFLALIPAAIASSKGRSFFLWWLYGVALLIFAFPHALLVSKNVKALEKKSIADGSMRQCPSCAEVVKVEAVVCRFCQRDLPAVEVAPKTREQQEEEMLILMDKYDIYFDGFHYFYKKEKFPNFAAALEQARQADPVATAAAQSKVSLL
jgi:regulator of RNase E activity RraB